MMTRILFTCVAMSLVLVMAGCQRGQTVDVGMTGTTPLPIEGHYSGNSPALTEPGAWLINSDEQLANLGAQGLTGGDAVDFDTQSLLVVAMGQQPTGGHWAHITAVQAKGEYLFFQGILNRPGADDVVTQALTHPYAAAVLPKVNATRVRNEMEEVEGQTPPQR
jgi:hypothetical protein